MLQIYMGNISREKLDVKNTSLGDLGKNLLDIEI